MKLLGDPHYRHRFPSEIISHAVRLFHVLNLSFRDVELIMAKRGVIVSYETVRRWCRNSVRVSPTPCVAAGHG
jgi:putative transposase